MPVPEGCVQIHDKVFKRYISREQLQERIAALGSEISRDYAGKNPLILAILNGCFVFAADLFRALSIDAEISFVKVQSYIGTQSGEKIVLAIGLQESLKDRHVLVLDDILDTGRTMEALLPDLKKQEPASIRFLMLLNKAEARIADIQPDYSGFEIPNAFVVGYGLDYDGLGRNLPEIYSVVN